MKRVLIVEDNRDLAYGLRNNLEIEGYEVDVAADGNAGLERARADPSRPGHARPHAARHGRLPRAARAARRRADHAGARPHRARRGERQGARPQARRRRLRDQAVRRARAARARRGAAAPRARRRPPRPSASATSSSIAPRTPSRCAAPPSSSRRKSTTSSSRWLDRNGAVVSRLDLMRQVWGYSDAVITRTIDTHIARAAAEAGGRSRAAAAHLDGAEGGVSASSSILSGGGRWARRINSSPTKHAPRELHVQPSRNALRRCAIDSSLHPPTALAQNYGRNNVNRGTPNFSRTNLRKCASSVRARVFSSAPLVSARASARSSSPRPWLLHRGRRSCPGRC